MKTKTIIIIAGVMAIIAVIMGAMGAHALKEVLSPEKVNSILTGVRYNMYHAIALIAVLGISSHLDPKWMKNGVLLMMIGTLLFSGSIYVLSTSSLTGIPLNAILGPATPIGGMLLILGWLSIIIGALKVNS
jgi:uncharacterized membrane protein YgdD (TMEM256/DUF423 family)